MTEARRHRRFADAVDVVRRLQPAEPVYCLRPETIRRAAQGFVEAFPGRTLYAVKCNPHPTVLRALHAGGVRDFDTASLGEIVRVRELWPEAGCYFMNPVKPRPAISTARHVHGVRAFVFDHADELAKMAAMLGRDPEVIAVVRIRTERAPGTLFHLAGKFGAEPHEAADLLRAAAAQGFRTGIAFHVGSQCLAPDAYRRALAKVGEVLSAAGVEPACIDVGGGFPAPYDGYDLPPLADFMTAIREGVAALDLPAACEVLAEPGRAVVARGGSVIAQVLLRKGDRLYLNDGVHGSLSEIEEAGLRVPARVLRPDGVVAGEPRRFDLAGPTCDSVDLVPGAVTLPGDVGEGDWIELDCLGAYSSALATHFNGFAPGSFVEVMDEPFGASAC